MGLRHRHSAARNRPAAAVLVAAAPLVGGCGGAHRSHSERDVERAFHDAGVPFQHEEAANPLLAGGTNFFPPQWKHHVIAFLARFNPHTFQGTMVWVFDSAASARRALQAFPFRRFVSNNPLIRERLGNVVIVGGGSPQERARTRRALAALR